VNTISEFAKKTVLGYKPVPGGYSDPECTHVILTKSEYDEILREKSQAEQKIWTTEYEAGRAVKRAQNEALESVRKAENDARIKIEGIERALEAEKAESGYQRRLNENLLRISKERANADRKLRPKKGHAGYIIALTVEKEQRYKDAYGRWGMVRLWETTIQSPYTVNFTEEQARRQIHEDLFKPDEIGNWFIHKIGIDGSYGKGYSEMIKDTDWKDVYHNHNVMLERRMRATIGFGYWEFVFMHTKPLGVIPMEMRVG
jgi:hypothetical protein